MTDDFDFYDLLEIDEDASQEEVKDAFRTKVREYHPDLNDDPDAPAQFTAVKKGYEILKDPAERQAYDRLGHKDYVAKRTSGIPDPSAWRTDDGGSGSGGASASTASGSSANATGGSSERSSRSSSSRSASSSGSSSSRSSSSSGSGSNRRSSSSRSSTSGSGSNRRSSSSRSSSSDSSAGDSSSGGSGSRSNRRGSSSSASTSTATESSNRRARSGSASTANAGGTPSGAGAGSGSATKSKDSTIGTRSEPASSSWTDNAVFNWWRSRNLGWPLMLASTLLFVVGVGYWVYANLGAFRTFAGALSTAGADAGALRAALTGRHGVPTMYAFVDGTTLVDPLLPTLQWYGALAGSVVATVLAFGVYRAVWAKRPYKWVTMNETVGVGLVTAAAATVHGGPLLAGAVVLPFVFAVIIRHTRAAYKFKPTYAYVLGVAVPLAVLGAEYAVQSPPLAVDLAAAVVPVLTVLVLLFSAFVRPKLFA